MFVVFSVSATEMAMAVTAVSNSCVECQYDRCISNLFGRCSQLRVQFQRVHDWMGLGGHGDDVDDGVEFQCEGEGYGGSRRS